MCCTVIHLRNLNCFTGVLFCSKDQKQVQEKKVQAENSQTLDVVEFHCHGDTVRVSVLARIQNSWCNFRDLLSF